MAPARRCSRTFRLSFLTQVVLVVSAVVVFPAAASSTSRCSNPFPATKEIPEGNDAVELLRSFQISTGYFSGGDRLFAPDDESSYIPRSFTFTPSKVARTTDSALLEVAATLTVYGARSSDGGGGSRRRRRSYTFSRTASFHIHGYYSFASAELCMVGAFGSYDGENGFVKHLRNVNFRLRVPNAPSLSDPFVTGLLDGADFETISLVAYVESDRYVFSEKKPSCPPLMPAGDAWGALQALEANFSCPHLKELLVSSYKLEHAAGDSSSPSSPTPLSLSTSRMMHVNQMHCTVNGSVRAYVVFSNDTDAHSWRWKIHSRFFVKEEAVVADGYWDATTSRLCLTACRVVHSSAATGPSSTDLKVGEPCGIGMSFWFPAVWTIRDRSVVAGLLWNASQEWGNKHAAGDVLSSAISASSIDLQYMRSSNLSDVKYNYTMVDTAKKQYIQTGLSKSKKGRFPGNSSTYSYQDFKFYFGRGEATPVTIGSVMVAGDMLAAEAAFFDHTMEEVNMRRPPALATMDHTQLLNISYDQGSQFRN
ncbi:hypothetical protein GUJ93_ZPchr0001g32175 [Zizania palustris]|uniref:DUF2921 domain-containing protein n=1 Tax=Zizania palustris TaxID=103762 RepID=A0A8J5VU77_ZIZPA|nr:hypothetical protein GUJ93_ZPchr0001g32175 [Zizania palustris]